MCKDFKHNRECENCVHYLKLFEACAVDLKFVKHTMKPKQACKCRMYEE